VKRFERFGNRGWEFFRPFFLWFQSLDRNDDARRYLVPVVASSATSRRLVIWSPGLLGEYPIMPLAEAREAALAALRDIAKGYY
jgi:hypothetical protein